MRRLEPSSLALIAAVCVTCTPAPTLRPSSALSTPDVTIGLTRDAALAVAIRSISAARIRETDSALVSFGTRHTMSDTSSVTRGIGAARRYLFAKLSGYSNACGGCLRIEYDGAMLEMRGHPDRPVVNVVNVLAWLPGRDTSRVLVMGGHYDSCICARTDLGPLARFEATQDAPGADDDGSGTSAVVELARVFSERFPRGLETSVIFVAYAGEEQGLYGSTHLAQRLHAAGYKIVSAFTDDIAGNVVAEDGTVDSTSVRIFGAEPDNGPSRELARYAWATGTIYNPGFQILPVFRLDRISVSYEVLFRRTTAATHEKIYQGGAGTSFLLPDQLDDGWAAVRAVGANGHRSLASAVPPPCPILTTRADSVAAGDIIRTCIRAPAR